MGCQSFNPKKSPHTKPHLNPKILAPVTWFKFSQIPGRHHTHTTSRLFGSLTWLFVHHRIHRQPHKHTNVVFPLQISCNIMHPQQRPVHASSIPIVLRSGLLKLNGMTSTLLNAHDPKRRIPIRVYTYLTTYSSFPLSNVGLNHIVMPTCILNWIPKRMISH